jgi:hypothetical protein
MKWNIVFLLSLFGVGMGIASLFGYTKKIELYEWIVIAVVVTYIIPKQTTHKVFLHGMYAGIGMGVLFTVVQISFFDVFLQHNTTEAEGFKAMFGGNDPRIFIFLSGPFIGAAYGVLIGAFAQLSAKFHIPE